MGWRSQVFQNILGNTVGFRNLGAQGLWRNLYTRGGETWSPSAARAVSHITLGCVPPFQSMPNQMRGRQRDPAALKMQLRGFGNSPSSCWGEGWSEQVLGWLRVSLPWLEEECGALIQEKGINVALCCSEVLGKGHPESTE